MQDHLCQSDFSSRLKMSKTPLIPFTGSAEKGNNNQCDGSVFGATGTKNSPGCRRINGRLWRNNHRWRLLAHKRNGYSEPINLLGFTHTHTRAHAEVGCRKRFIMEVLREHIHLTSKRTLYFNSRRIKTLLSTFSFYLKTGVYCDTLQKQIKTK